MPENAVDIVLGAALLVVLLWCWRTNRRMKILESTVQTTWRRFGSWQKKVDIVESKVTDVEGTLEMMQAKKRARRPPG